MGEAFIKLLGIQKMKIFAPVALQNASVFRRFLIPPCATVFE